MVKARNASDGGFSLLELLVVVVLSGLLMGIAAVQLDTMGDGLKAGVDRLTNVIRLSRSLAMSNTTPHRLVARSSNSVAIEWGGPCGDPAAVWTEVPKSTVELPAEITFADPTWTVCFNSRGWTTDVHNLDLTDGDGSTQGFEVLLGGAIEVGAIQRHP